MEPFLWSLGLCLSFQGHMVTVAGKLNLQGQSTNHITITAQDVFPPVIMVEKGNVTMAFTDVGGQNPAMDQGRLPSRIQPLPVLMEFFLPSTSCRVVPVSSR